MLSVSSSRYSQLVLKIHLLHGEFSFRDMCMQSYANEVRRAVQWRRADDDQFTLLNGLVHFWIISVSSLKLREVICKNPQHHVSRLAMYDLLNRCFINLYWTIQRIQWGIVTWAFFFEVSTASHTARLPILVYQPSLVRSVSFLPNSSIQSNSSQMM